MKSVIKEKTGKIIFTAAAIICIIAAVAIFIFMFVKSIPAFKKIGLFDFIFGDNWSPDRLDKYDEPLSGSYGIFKMIVGTAAATACSLLFGGTLGYFTAVFITFYCPKKLKRLFSSTINLLAGIPSVVYGFFGIMFLLPLLSNIAPNNGSGLLATAIILGIIAAVMAFAGGMFAGLNINKISTPQNVVEVRVDSAQNTPKTDAEGK